MVQRQLEIVFRKSDGSEAIGDCVEATLMVHRQPRLHFHETDSQEANQTRPNPIFILLKGRSKRKSLVKHVLSKYFSERDSSSLHLCLSLCLSVSLSVSVSLFFV